MTTPGDTLAAAVFPGFAWKDETAPDLHLNPAGFLEDPEGRWHMVRRTRHDVPLDEVGPHHLYNGRRPSRWNATEGHGLYFVNHPRAARIPFICGEELYVGRLALGPQDFLDATASPYDLSGRDLDLAWLLRARSVIPGFPRPPQSIYDKLYGDKAMVICKPLAIARALSSGTAQQTPAGRIPPKWTIVRSIEHLEVIGKR